MHGSETVKLHWMIMAFLETVDIGTMCQSVDTGGSLDLNDWLFCGRLVTTTYDLNREELDRLI